MIEANKVVGIHYTLTDEAGEKLDSSEGQGPLQYLHGGSNIIPGLEKALEGKEVGDALNVEVAPEEGYGEREDNLVQDVPISAFPDADQIEVGRVFSAESDRGNMQVRIAAVEGETVTVDGNHPLAGKVLTFDVTVDSVRDATEEELEHGHAHGPGGHDH